MAASSSSSSSLLKKRHKLSEDDNTTKEGEGEGEGEEEEALLPGLPDHLAQLCLSQQQHQILFSVCRPWRRLLYSPSFPAPPFLSLYALLITATSSSSSSSIHFACFDPLSSKWSPLPPPPHHHRLLLRHPSFISRHLPIQTVSAAGKLLLLAATDRRLRPALPNPSLFDPNTAQWIPAPDLPSGPRRWCAAGSAGGALYVASGVGSEYTSETARSAERWNILDMITGGGGGGGWEAVCSLKDSRFSREPMGMVWSRSNNKLCMVDRNVKEGAVYDVGSDRWEEMPPGMLSGWNGPAAGEGDFVYVVEESSGVMRRYEWERDTWTDVVPLEEEEEEEEEGLLLEGACAMAGGGGGGKVVVASREGTRVTVVDVAAGAAGSGGKWWWEVVVPEGMRVMAMHVLPRMCSPS